MIFQASAVLFWFAWFTAGCWGCCLGKWKALPQAGPPWDSRRGKGFPLLPLRKGCLLCGGLLEAGAPASGQRGMFPGPGLFVAGASQQ